MEPSILVEQKVLHLFLHYKNCIAEAIENGIREEFFAKSHVNLFTAIYQEYLESSAGRLLTRNSYKQFLFNNNLNNNLNEELSVYDHCLLTPFAKQDDFGSLVKLLIENYIKENTGKFLLEFKETSQKKGYTHATQNLCDNLSGVLNSAKTVHKTVLKSIDEMKDEFI